RETLPDTSITLTYSRATEKVNMVRSSLDIINSDYDQKRKDMRFYLIEWHRKFALSFACFVLFMIGAPLGSIIRKGGLGTPLIFAIIFFMIFYFSSTAGEKFAKENSLSPFGGMWLATFILLPVGIFLIYKAMHDSQLFNKEVYARFIRLIGKFFHPKQGKIIP
ncbi:MAG: LptF/LptG family permease, partial [Bacteroidota bacterium]